MTGAPRLMLSTAARAAALRHLERRIVDPVALLAAIHDAADTKALADARLAAVFQIGAVGEQVWPGPCPVTTGSDALAVGCDTDLDKEGRVVHARHEPISFVRRISRVTVRAESRLDGTDTTSQRRTA